MTRPRDRRRERGSVLIEAIPVLLVLLIFAFLALQVTVALWAANETTSAARAGGRVASLGGDGRAAAVVALPAPLKRANVAQNGSSVTVVATIPRVFPFPIDMPQFTRTAQYVPSEPAS